MKLTSLILSALLTSTSFASIVAVIDSGLQVDHPLLESKVWQNTAELNGEDGVDDDNNGVIDDIHGWDYFDNTPELLNPLLFTPFKEKYDNYYYIQGIKIRMESGLIPLDKEFIDKFKVSPVAADASAYGLYSHGTHVSGIVARDNPNVKIIGLKAGNLTGKLYLNDILAGNYESTALGDTKALREVAKYAGQKGARVANCSFGADYSQPINRLQELSLKGYPMAQVKYIARQLQLKTLETQSLALKEAPNTLFVFASGNSGFDNDKFIMTPANVNIGNALTVAATIDRDALPAFSSYGANTVHVAAPGVAIRSTTVDDAEMFMTGTSMAAPYVTRVASLIFDENNALTPKQVKQILIQTVDKKDFLKGKVISSGIVNDNRAIEAAILSKSMPLNSAIEIAKHSVNDM